MTSNSLNGWICTGVGALVAGALPAGAGENPPAPGFDQAGSDPQAPTLSVRVPR